MADPNTLTASHFQLDAEQPSPEPDQRALLTSSYRVSTGEQLRGVANRIIFSRYYLLHYLVTIILSIATVVLSLIATSNHKCPPAAWHVLEVIVNLLMVGEVTIRWIAYGKKYPLTLLNTLDLALVALCLITLICVFASPCGEGTRREEIIDTVLLVIRNVVQFMRLGNILRRSGYSLLHPPKPMDLSQAHGAVFALDLDIEDDEALAERNLRGANRSDGYIATYSDEA